MKRLISALLGLVVVLGLTTGPAAADARTDRVTKHVSAVNFAFMPQKLKITRGTAVKWTNTSATTTHTTTSNSGLWAHTLPPGGSFKRVFNRAGTFRYHCTIHPSMTGSIVVSG